MELYLFETATRKEDAYAVLAYAARRCWGFETLPHIARHEQGKPHFPAHPHCHFNLSHSGTFALCTVDEQPVGADIEVIRPHHPRLAQRICSAEELVWLKEQPDKNTALCQLWTCKEALVKYSGTGLTVPLREICVPLPPLMEQNGLQFYSITTPDFCLCVCGHTAPKNITTLTHEEIFR
ncbi:MAG: 4'-phosphopantetheinyl transferase superfamily protein [Ruminococcaceae bacterium]|nr:4'-phosphopantetheinyl transferase superfamily protein [Oscillospiraceae bacterium]